MRLRGFTMIELLVVVAVTGILAGLVISLAGRLRYQALTLECRSNFRQQGLAYMAYASEHRNRFPS